MLEKTEKLVKIKGKYTFVVREQYLRDDVKCHSPLCTSCNREKNNSKEVVLDKNATHYAIPCLDVVQKYLEVLEIPSLTGIIILQSTACKILQDNGRRHYERYINIGRDNRRGCAVFLNEICKKSHVSRLKSESIIQWLNRATMEAARYYDQHLNSELPIIVISETPEILQSVSSSNNIKYLSLKAYLDDMHGNLESATELYNSISASLLLQEVKDSSKLYSNYLPSEVLEAGVKTGRFFKGFLRVNKHHPSEEAFVTASRAFVKDSGDILVSAMKHRNRAIHGDEVVVEILPRNEWKSRCRSLVPNSGEETNISDSSSEENAMTSGKVVGILERRWRDYVASLPEDEENGSTPKMGSERILVIPYDYRIPKIRIPTRQGSKLRNQRIIVRIDGWDKDSQYPNGHFVKALGDIGDPETEIQTLLVEHSIFMSEFPDCLIPELPKSSKEDPWKIDESEVAKRRDLRESHLVFSIDPIGCEDVDDALSVRCSENGNIELGVHIADVTFFVPPLSLTDLEARSRSTSVYLPDRRYDMLPHVLSGDVCSLWGNVDRYAVSVIWELDSNYDIKKVWYGRTVLRSKYKLTYEVAQDVLSGKSVNEVLANIPELDSLADQELEARFFELKDAILKLGEIYQALKSKRLLKGGLELNSTSFKFEIDNRFITTVTGIKPAQELLIHKIVAECMIFANEWVAKKIYEAFPKKALLRRHPSPREADLKELQRLALSKGYSLKIGSNKELAESLELAFDPNDSTIHKILLILATQAMNQATYFSTGCYTEPDFYHYGLALETYTHFTSPIRRYADILVHRLLLAAVNNQNSSDLLKSTDLEDLCHHMNMKHRAAQDVEKAVQELFQVMYFSDMSSQDEGTPNCVVDGIIYSLKTNGMLVFVPLYGIRGAVCLCNKDKKVAVVKDDGIQWVDGRIEVCETHINVKTPDCIQQYNMFNHITVSIRVQKSRAHNPRVVLDLVKNEPYVLQLPVPVTEDRNCEVAEDKQNDASRNNARDRRDDMVNGECSAPTPGYQNLYAVLQRLKALTLQPPK